MIHVGQIKEVSESRSPPLWWPSLAETRWQGVPQAAPCISAQSSVRSGVCPDFGLGAVEPMGLVCAPLCKL